MTTTYTPEQVRVGDLVKFHGDERWYTIEEGPTGDNLVRVTNFGWFSVSNIEAVWGGPGVNVSVSTAADGSYTTYVTTGRFYDERGGYGTLPDGTGRRMLMTADGIPTFTTPALVETTPTGREWTADDFAPGDLIFLGETVMGASNATTAHLNTWVKVVRVDWADRRLPLLVTPPAGYSVWVTYEMVKAKWEAGLRLTGRRNEVAAMFTALPHNPGERWMVRLIDGSSNSGPSESWIAFDTEGRPGPYVSDLRPATTSEPQAEATTPEPQNEVERLEAERAALQAELERVRLEAQQFKDRTVETARQYVANNGSDFRSGVEEILENLGLEFPVTTIDKTVTVTFRLQATAVDHTDEDDYSVQSGLDYSHLDSDNENGEALTFEMDGNWDSVDFSNITVSVSDH